MVSAITGDETASSALLQGLLAYWLCMPVDWTIAGSNVKGDELPRDGTRGIYINLLLHDYVCNPAIVIVVLVVCYWERVTDYLAIMS